MVSSVLRPLNVAAVAALALALGLVFWQLPTPYWFDEANTIAYVRQPVRRMLQLVAHDFAPPAYYLVLQGWVRVFGDGEVATGSLSLVFAMFALYLTYSFGRALGGAEVARTAAVLFGVSAAFIFSASETRMYAMLMALAVAAAWGSYGLLTDGRWRWALLLLMALLAGSATHYAFWFFALGLPVAFAVSRGLRGRGPGLRRFGVTWWLGAVGISLLLPLLVVQLRGWYFTPEPKWVDQHPLTWQFLWRVPGELILTPADDWPWWLAAVVGAAVLLVAGRGLIGSWRSIPAPAALLLVMIAFPLFVLVGLNVQVPRYAVAVAPLMSLLLAVGVHRFRPAWRP